jgi:hypothetical protein
MAHDSVFAPRYTNSWALVIGINKYTIAPPLGYACNDADAVAQHLIDRLQFPPAQVYRLRDNLATRQAITSSFLALADQVAVDDRVIIFFAGHGFTRPSRRGEVGFLVPFDGDPKDLSTLVRWDELTRNGELIPAKHVLFIMDACYGGLALTRTVPSGSQRFLKDMLARYSRQVLTAGKADEVVADAGGPRPGHSIFTGHLLNALDGACRTSDGIITANGVMAYVYDRVAKDQFSQQSPHYGFLEGDGDLVFEAPQLDNLLADDQRDDDVLVEQAAPSREVPAAEDRQAFAAEAKEYLSDPRYRIRLDDLTVRELRSYHQAVTSANFPLTTSTHTPEDVAERLRGYERAANRLACIAALVARWGGPEHRGSLGTACGRLVENYEPTSGQSLWLGLRWHPADYFLCASGVSAIAAGSYDNLATILLSNLGRSRTGQVETTIVEATIDGVWDAVRAGAYKVLPGYERHYVPRSEYLFKVVQPLVEDLLYVGRSYEQHFDRYEVLTALVYADLSIRAGNQAWGPPGRFAWKAKRGYSGNPFEEFVAEGERLKENWPVLRAGFFEGSYSRFEAAVTAYRALLAQLPFH